MKEQRRYQCRSLTLDPSLETQRPDRGISWQTSCSFRSLFTLEGASRGLIRVRRKAAPDRVGFVARRILGLGQRAVSGFSGIWISARTVKAVQLFLRKECVHEVGKPSRMSLFESPSRQSNISIFGSCKWELVIEVGGFSRAQVRLEDWRKPVGETPLTSRFRGNSKSPQATG